MAYLFERTGICLQYRLNFAHPMQSVSASHNVDTVATCCIKKKQPSLCTTTMKANRPNTFAAKIANSAGTSSASIRWGCSMHLERCATCRKVHETQRPPAVYIGGKYYCKVSCANQRKEAQHETRKSNRGVCNSRTRFEHG